ncbi:MAG TPA: hypothetical protein VHP11_04880 [Tepidisphaeraceae bacterium]|nr:hypothetical protein [Tepidisphaeraceae bacterium]
MRHRLFAILSVISLLLCAATGMLWLRTFFVRDDIRICGWERSASRYDELRIQSGGDLLSIFFTRSTPTGHQRFPGLRWNHERYPLTHYGPQSRLWSWLWWDHYLDQQPNSTDECWRVQVRPWLLLLPPLILPAGWALGDLRQHRTQRKGLCVQCGYDLRASKERCPECGTPIIDTDAKAAAP